MSIIYEPKGKAREYAPLSCNLYSGCNHGCVYCYAPGIRRMSSEQYKEITPRRNVLKDFENDCKRNVGSEKPVLFCFMTDPYNSLDTELRLTREALKLCHKYRIPTQVLSKSKTLLNDIDVFIKMKEHIHVGMTLTASTEKTSLDWEPGASLPEERIETLKELKKNGVVTWASFEPVYNIEESLAIMEDSLCCVDIYKVGKINNYRGLDKIMDWSYFLNCTVEMLRRNNKPFYIKQDLREAAPAVRLYGNEIIMDDFLPRPYPQQAELF